MIVNTMCDNTCTIAKICKLFNPDSCLNCFLDTMKMHKKNSTQYGEKKPFCRFEPPLQKFYGLKNMVPNWWDCAKELEANRLLFRVPSSKKV